MTGKFGDFISYMITAISNCSLYSKDHQAITELSEKAIAVLNELYIDNVLSITLLGKSLILNDTSTAEKGIHIENFIKRLRIKGIEKIIFKKGTDVKELSKFISEMASRDETPTCSEHILVGTVQVRFKSSDGEITSIMNENISKIKEVYHGVSRFKQLDMVSLEDAVIGFISAIKREADVLRIISPVKSYSEYTYVHAANVSVLTLFQAESLGLAGETLHDAGFAGLLHDVGKMFISKEVLEKQTGLNPEEWDEMKKHPIYGAMYLSNLQDVPKLAVIAAFEHHMKFNGTGYPDTKIKGKKQHLISQLVAISDFFDALRTERPYRRSLGTKELVELMKKTEGKDFSPALVGNFLRALKRIGVL